LVDEYDAPVIKVIQTPGLKKIEGLLEDTRTVMSDFYSKIKSMDQDLYFTFITGVTKFSRMGVFSALNNLIDISLMPEFSSIVGFTHEELASNFGPFIEETAASLRLGETETLAKMREYYDGFSFDGETRLYNPQSTLQFFQDKQFNNYWMKSGSDTLIREMLRNEALTVEQFRGFRISHDFAEAPGEIEATPAHGFLYQAGYLTLRKDADQESPYWLDYPNFEVLSSLSKLFLDIVFKSDPESTKATHDLQNHLKDGDIEAIVNDFVILYLNFTYDDQVTARRLKYFYSIANDTQADITRQIVDAFGILEFKRQMTQMNKEITGGNPQMADTILRNLIEKSGQPKEIRLKLNESLYRANLKSFLLGAKVKVLSELHNNKGRSDLVLELAGKHYVIELKVVEKSSEAQNAAHRAITQIIEKDYARAFPNPILMGLGISEEDRNIVACDFVKGNKLDRLVIGKPLAEVLKLCEQQGQTKMSLDAPETRGPKP
jgi:hypothetical protein